MDRVTAIQVFAYLFTLIVLPLPPATCCEIREVKYNYDFSSEKGPPNWGNLPGSQLCRDGRMQSPINLDISRANVVLNSGIQTNYRPANATLISTDHDIMVNWTENAGFITINGTQYRLVQCHWHSPSEHTINGRRFDLELHLVHSSSDEKIAVIGILYNIGNRNHFISKIEDVLKLMGDNKTNARPLGIVDPKQITGQEVANNSYYRYYGSLTTPPCCENVTWTVSTKQETVTREQIRLLRKAVDGDERYTNARPLQPLNGRPVQLYKPIR